MQCGAVQCSAVPNRSIKCSAVQNIALEYSALRNRRFSATVISPGVEWSLEAGATGQQVDCTVSCIYSTVYSVYSTVQCTLYAGHYSESCIQ